MQEKSRALIKTVLYSDIFHYPLTLQQLVYYSIGQKIDNNISIHTLPFPIVFKKGYFYIKGKEKSIHERIKREKISEKKIEIAKKYAKILRLIPTIELIGISGSLAMMHAKKEDDIDLFIITKGNALWITRMAVLLLLRFLRVRRERKTAIFEDKICANMFMDNRSLLIPKNMQNLFTAHEVMQMNPLFVRNNTYSLFLQYNTWVRKYLPNAIKQDIHIRQHVSLSTQMIVLFFENLVKTIQLWYMSGHRTREVVTDTLLAFHPNDQSPYVLKAYDNKCKKYNI